MPKHFITFEGGEGSGKTTICTKLTETLKKEGHTIVHTKEPGGTPFADKIRQLLLEQPEETITPITETLLLFASRTQHIAKVIVPALEKGAIVLCERFTDSTFAYQGGARNVPEEYLNALETISLKTDTGTLKPSLTIYLDVDPEVAFQRIQTREKDRFESEDIDFHNTIRKAFQKRMEHCNHCKTVDASQSLEKVEKEVYTLITNHLTN